MAALQVRMEESTLSNTHGDPPKIGVNLPKVSELTHSRKLWSEVQLPIDILLLTLKDVEFLSCYCYINDPIKSYLKGLGLFSEAEAEYVRNCEN